MNKTTLKTLPSDWGSKTLCLNHILASLSAFAKGDLIRHLSRIGKTLHHASSVSEGQKELLENYASAAMKADMQKDNDEGISTILFHRCGLKLIDELLRLSPVKIPVSSLYQPTNDYILKKKLLITSKLVEHHLSIDFLFLLANTLINHLEGEPSELKFEEYSEQAKFFYSRLDIDRSVALGRSRMYKYQDFPARLQAIGINIEEYINAIFALCAHIESHPFIELELPASIRQMHPEAQKILDLYIPRISSVMQSEAREYKSMETQLCKSYFTDALCRQRPLIQIDKRYYCLQPKFLWAALADLPYYLLLDSCNGNQKEVQSLGRAWGDAFEESVRNLGFRIFGSNNVEDYECKEVHPKFNLKKGHRIGDLLVTHEKDIKVLFEFKGVAPDDYIKLGDRARARKKFIQQDDNKGIPQLIRDSTVYRHETLFNGIIYIIFVCRGPIPLTSDFDEDLKKYLDSSTDYQAYLCDKQNKPLIYLDAISAEFLFSAVRQGLPFDNTLKNLAGLAPSQVLITIRDEIRGFGLKTTLASLYKEEIEQFAQECRSMFSD
jgi:hypothetical protein